MFLRCRNVRFQGFKDVGHEGLRDLGLWSLRVWACQGVYGVRWTFRALGLRVVGVVVSDFEFWVRVSGIKAVNQGLRALGF